MLLRPNPRLVKSEFLVWMINSDYVYAQAAQLARGATNPHVNVADVRKFRIILPPINLQSKFASTVEKFEAFRENREKSSQGINVLCNSLMHQAFRGELDLVDMRRVGTSNFEKMYQESDEAISRGVRVGLHFSRL
jgi:type I restriction enzyme S subunit